MNEKFEEIVEPKAVMKNYFYSIVFTFDIVAVFPFEFIELENADGVVLLKFLKIIRLFRMGKLLKRFEKNEES